MFQYESEFKYRNIVLISCGVNDLSSYGMRGRELANKVCPQLLETCRKHPSTTFIFNSILYTRHGWLNDEIDVLNNIMFDLSIMTQNFNFFDSSSVISNHPLGRKVDNIIEPRDPRKLHITRAARVLISEHIVNGIELICSRNKGKLLSPILRSWKWPLRNEYIDTLSQTRDNRRLR